MPRTLLLADDSVTIQRVIELTFADEDIQVVAVSDGDQAIERLERTTPDIVLADIGMPGRNGYEVAQYIRQTPRLAHIPVVLLTGAFEPVDQERAAEAGCDGVLAKPFEPQMVIGRVKELLARPRPPVPTSDVVVPEPPASAPEPVESLDQWVPPAADEPQTIETAEQGTGELNDYFDRLDAAFANLGSGPSAMRPAAAATEPTEPPISDQWDLDALDPAPAHDLSLSLEAPAPLSADPDPEAVVAALSMAATPVAAFPPAPPIDHVGVQPSWASVPEMTAPIAPIVPTAPTAAVAFEPTPSAKPMALPALADAFAALLAAEQGSPLPDVAPGWPASAATTPAQAAPAEITDEVIETIARRVLDRLSDQVVRETVADIVSKVAERMIAEEIARIKAAIE